MRSDKYPLLLVLSNIPSLPPYTPDSPVRLHHDPRVEIRHLPLLAPKRILARRDDPIELTRDAVAGRERADIALDVRRAEAGHEHRALGLQEQRERAAPRRGVRDLEEGLARCGERARGGGEAEAGREEEEHVCVRVERVGERGVHGRIGRLDARERELRGVGHGVGGRAVDVDRGPCALLERDGRGGRRLVDVRDVALLGRVGGRRGRLCWSLTRWRSLLRLSPFCAVFPRCSTRRLPRPLDLLELRQRHLGADEMDMEAHAREQQAQLLPHARGQAALRARAEHEDAEHGLADARLLGLGRAGRDVQRRAQRGERADARGCHALVRERQARVLVQHGRDGHRVREQLGGVPPHALRVHRREAARVPEDVPVGERDGVVVVNRPCIAVVLVGYTEASSVWLTYQASRTPSSSARFSDHVHPHLPLAVGHSTSGAPCPPPSAPQSSASAIHSRGTRTRRASARRHAGVPAHGSPRTRGRARAS